MRNPNLNVYPLFLTFHPFSLNEYVFIYSPSAPGECGPVYVVTFVKYILLLLFEINSSNSVEIFVCLLWLSWHNNEDFLGIFIHANFKYTTGYVYAVKHIGLCFKLSF